MVGTLVAVRNTRLVAFSSESSAHPALSVLESGGITWQTAELAIDASLYFDLGSATSVREVRLEQCRSSLGASGQLFARVTGEVEGGAPMVLFERQRICTGEPNALLSLDAAPAITRLSLELDVIPRKATFSLRRVRLLREATREEAEISALRSQVATLKQQIGGAPPADARRRREDGRSIAPLALPDPAPVAPAAARPLSAMLEGARPIGTALTARQACAPDPTPRKPKQRAAPMHPYGARPPQCAPAAAPARGGGGAGTAGDDARDGWRQGGGKRRRPVAPVDGERPPVVAIGVIELLSSEDDCDCDLDAEMGTPTKPPGAPTQALSGPWHDVVPLMHASANGRGSSRAMAAGLLCAQPAIGDGRGRDCGASPICIDLSD
ncbi:hypothetical protein KFE25_007532 [Diacronema lutheri]|uniref:Uncharacterized protein n=1 Tax=Diacronema lutheri TaxID=2081491 RepID=A0A8J6CDV8_DIALT|nr:hypothetical protein KFE25_007532 [Diacronema lutheri]